MTAHRIVLANFGSFGDLHPYLGVARELQRRGHQPVIATVPHYRDKVEAAGFLFAPVRFAEIKERPGAAEMARILHLRTGPEYILRDLVMPSLRTAYGDTAAALGCVPAGVASADVCCADGCGDAQAAVDFHTDLPVWHG